MSARPVLVARGLCRSFGGQRALAPLDLELAAGEAMALVGPNGAGKSTLLSLLAGALRPDGGSVEWADGVRVGWVPQRAAHYGRLSARENLELFARLERRPDPVEEAERLLTLFDLPREARPSATLSVGNRQRLDVAVALLGRPDALLLDEPTASLDPGQRRRLWETAAEVRARGGTVVFSTQNLEEVEHVADRVLVLRAGALEWQGPAAELGSAGELWA